MRAPDPEVTRIGRYELVTPLGQGGMARVYVAINRGPLGFDKLAVVKQIRPELASDREFLAMFFDEARIAARLNHPNVVQTYEAVEDAGRYILAMEYLEGQTLTDVLRRVGRTELPLDEHLWILTQVLSGLHYAHELRDFDGKPLGVVHRDVSPSNVLITYNGEVKLLDFGVAKAAGAISVTHKGMVKGKLAYGAPEQFLGQPVDRRADVFAVGVMMWEALARKRRKLADTPAATFGALMTKRLRVAEAAPDSPAALAAICDRAVEVDPVKRYQTAAEFQRELDRYLEEHARRVERRELAALMRWYFDEDRKELGKRLEGLLTGTASASPMPASVDAVAHSSAPNATVSDVVAGRLGPSRDSAIPDFRPKWARHGAAIVVAAGIGTLAVAGSLKRGDSRPVAGSASDAWSAAPSAFVTPVPIAEVPRANAAPVADPSLVWLTLHVDPPKAVAFLDGKQLAGNPFRAEVPRDSRLHVLRATSPGFGAAERVVSFASDVDLQITLRESATSARSHKADPPAQTADADAEAAASSESTE